MQCVHFLFTVYLCQDPDYETVPNAVLIPGASGHDAYVDAQPSGDVAFDRVEASVDGVAFAEVLLLVDDDMAAVCLDHVLVGWSLDACAGVGLPVPLP